MNKAILMGRLTANPEIKMAQNGAKVARYRLAVDRMPTKDGNREADFISCVAFSKTAEFAEKYLAKGTKVLVEGRIQTGSYEKDGVKRSTTDIIVERHEFCESRNAAVQAAQAAPQASEAVQTAAGGSAEDFTPIDDGDDLPF